MDKLYRAQPAQVEGELPILFSAPMIRSILNEEKTLSRRVAALNEAGRVQRGGRQWHVDDPQAVLACPFGQVGQRLWVRETWGVVSHSFSDDGDIVDWNPNRPAKRIREMPFGQGYYSGHVIYAADGPFEWSGDDDGGGEPRSEWKPSIHMPRKASRLCLELTDVRLERLHEISDADCWAEGIGEMDGLLDEALICALAKEIGCSFEDPKATFAALWESLGGAGAWRANPLVWVLAFAKT